jgi:2-polyprenyl-3-methyl-5-hydroxy-6-metoxy-1,4-benzoquinol methylase
MDAAAWDDRYASAPLVWSSTPNALFAEVTASLPPGRALDIAAGEGRNALWLAQRGWQVTAIDFSRVAIDKARARAAAAGLAVDWQVADVTVTAFGSQAYDLVAVLYLHLPPGEMRDVLVRAAAAVAPGGTLFVLGHDRDNLEHGCGGPQDPTILHTTDSLAEATTELTPLRLEQVRRPTPEGDAIDTLLVAARRAGPSGR